MGVAAERRHLSDTDARLRAAAQCLASRDVKAALAQLDPLVRDGDGDLPAQFLLGLAAWRMKNYAGAVSLVRRCHERAPANGTYAETLATLYALVGDLRESLFVGKLATALGPDPDTATLIPADFPSFGTAFFNISGRPLAVSAGLHEDRGTLDEAFELLRQHVELNPADEAATARYISLALRLGRPGAAASVAGNIARSTDPDRIALAASALCAAGMGGVAAALHAEAAAAAPERWQAASLRAADSRWNDDRAASDRLLCLLPGLRPASIAPAPSRQHARLRIGYVVAGVAATDAPFIAAVARSHDRKRTELYGYGVGHLDWSINAPYRAAFDGWCDVARIDPVTLARFFEREGLDVLVDAAGLDFPAGFAAIANLRGTHRLGWSAPAGLETVYDALILPDAAADGGMAAVRAGAGDLPLPFARRPPAAARKPSDAIAFGIDAAPVELDDSTLAMLRRVLEAVPSTFCLFRDHGLSHPAIVDRLVAGLGREAAARVDIIRAEDAGAFYCEIDLAIAPLRSRSSRQAVEAVSRGVPLIAAAAPQARNPAVLIGAGLAAHVAGDADALVAEAVSFATDPVRRDAARGAAAQAMQRDSFKGERIAAAIESVIGGSIRR